MQDDINFEWKENANGNFVCLRHGSLEATVFNNKDELWQIIINGSPLSFLVKNEWFDDPDEAISRTEEILRGASCEFMKLIPRQS